MARLKSVAGPKAADVSAAWQYVAGRNKRHGGLMGAGLNTEAHRLEILEERFVFHVYGAGSDTDLDPRFHRFGGSRPLTPLTPAELAEYRKLRALAEELYAADPSSADPRRWPPEVFAPAGWETEA